MSSLVFLCSRQSRVSLLNEKGNERYFFKRLHQEDDEDDDDDDEESPALPKRIVGTVELENLLLSREEGAKREGKREGDVSTARSRWWVAFGFFKSALSSMMRIFQKTNERTGRKEKERKTHLNVQIVARGNDASFGNSDFRHRAWSDRDRRRHRQRYSWCCSRSSLSLSLGW